MHNPRERMLTAKQLASQLGVHPNYIYGLAKSGKLPSFKIGGNRRFLSNEVEAWLESHRQ